MITEVRAKNFLSWESMEFDLKNGVTLIDGWNEDDQTSEGSGKSAILNAICWGLFGKIPKDANIDDVIKEGEKSCGVDVVFGDFAIRRTRGPNELALIVGGQVRKGKDAKETQILIEEFVGLTFETFCQTIYFAQNYTKKFITSNQEEKGKILSEVQDLVIFDKAGKEVRNLIKLDEDSLTKLKQSKELSLKDQELIKRDIEAEGLKFEHAKAMQMQRIVQINNQIASLEAANDHALQQQAQRIQGLDTQVQDAQRLAYEHEQAKAQLLASVASLVYNEAAEKALQEANNQLMAQVGAINAEIAGIDKLIAAKKTAETQGQRYATRYKQLIAEKEKNLAFIANPSKDCPTCGTKLETCDTSHAEADVVRIDGEIAELLVTLTALSAEIDAPIPTKDELNVKLGEIRQQRLVNEAEIQNIRSIKDKMNRTGAHLSACDHNIKAQQDRAAKLLVQLEREKEPLILDTAKLNALQIQVGQVASEEVPFDRTQTDALTEKLQIVGDAIVDLDRIIADKTKHLSRLETLKNGFKEIKSFVFNSMLNEINARVQKYLSHLFEVPVSVRFKNEEMKIETEVKFDGADRGLGLLSGGQFRRVSLAVDLALSDVIVARKGANVGVLILDEYFKDLSESSMEKCLTLLEGRGQPVLLIEHNSVFKNIVNNSVMVRLENGTSRVEIQGN